MEQENFKSKLGIIAATAGSAVGLGNIWAFSYKAGVNGGGTFVLIYLFCILFIGVPVMLAEFVIGRHGRGGPVGSFENIAGKGSPVVLGGYIGSITTFLILAFYSVIAGWSISYLSKTIPHGFAQFSESSGMTSGDIFGATVASADTLPNAMICQTIFIALTIGVVMFGIQKGIERISKIMMPLLLLIIIIIVIYGFTLPGFGDAVKFLFLPTAIPEGKTIFGVAVSAMGHAFFTLSLGMGAIITYARAVPDDVNLNKISMQVVICDTCIALLAGLAIFPIIFSTPSLSPGDGAGLAFISLPVAFSQMKGGYIIGNLFFILLLIAALTSSISMLENTLTTVLEKTPLPRKKATIGLGLVILLFGFLCQLGQNFVTPLLAFTHQSTFLDQLNILTTNFTIPIGAFLIIILVGFKMKPEAIKKQINNETISNIFIPYVKYVAPILVAIIFLASLFPEFFK